MSRRSLVAPAMFVAGFAFCILAGKGVAGAHVLGTVVPNGIFVEGLVLGSLNGLLAIGLVLIYRTNRIINFAQGELGAFAATVASELYRRYNWPFVPSVLAGVACCIAMTVLLEFGVIRRFNKAPRLILTVVTLGIAQFLFFVELTIHTLAEKGNIRLRHDLQAPVPVTVHYGGVVFRGDHILVLLITPVVIGALIWFLRGTGYGLAARASAENGDRARLLGVDVKRVSSLVWVLAAMLSATTAILQVPIIGSQINAVGGFTLLLRALAAAVIGRMENLVVTFMAAVLITVGQQAVFFGTGKSGPDDGLVLIVLVVALLVQRRRLGRLAEGGSTWTAVAEVRPVPAELRRVPEVRAATWALRLGGLVLLAVPLTMGPRNLSLISSMIVYAMVGVSLVVLTGWSGNVSFGQWAFVGVGAMIATKLASQPSPIDFFLILLAGSVAGVIVAVLIGLPAIRIRGLFLGVTTLAFAVAAGNWMFKFDILTMDTPSIPRPVLFGVWDLSPEKSFYVVCAVGLLGALAVGRNIRRSRFGRVLVSTRDNESQAQSLGVSIVRARLTVFTLAGFMAAFAGVLYAYLEQNLRADRFQATGSIDVFVMVVIGGMGSLLGALIGAVWIRGIIYFLSAQFQPLAQSTGLILVLWLFPGGLAQLVYGQRDNLLRWVAKRHDIHVPSLVADRRVEDAAARLRHAAGLDGESPPGEALPADALPAEDLVAVP